MQLSKIDNDKFYDVSIPNYFKNPADSIKELN